jgi:4-deoxy-L-threo-5-hexosulose-uronate ketol-isomerase
MKVFEMRYMPGPQQVSRMNTAELRESFLIESLFTAGEITMYAIDLDRVLVGGAVPQQKPLDLEAPPAIAAEFFTERRELGILNIGGAGTVTVDGDKHQLRKLDVLYVGRSARSVVFASDVAQQPARFYLVSYPAHGNHPTRKIAAENAESAELGTNANANRRRLSKYIHPGAVPSAQLVMGVTELHGGSVWNTMPPHTHQRRTEIYLYFDVPPDAVVFHLLGAPNETRNLVVRDGQVALSPSWSVHAGCGTSNYRFCWAMGGENQVFSDMQGVDMSVIR